MLGPMFPLAIGVAILDKHTQHTCLETDTLSCHAAAIGTADVDLVHIQGFPPHAVERSAGLGGLGQFND